MSEMAFFGHIREHMDTEVADRFIAKVAAADGCWEWIGTKDVDGYGVFKIKGKMYKSHRLAFLVAFGWLPSKGYFICHKCDNRSCVNPSHLFAGLPSDNSFDMVSKGRSAKGPQNASARLNEEQVREIISRLAQGAAKRALAREYDVSAYNIYCIAIGKTWRYIRQEAL
jgi:hypothetical protein